MTTDKTEIYVIEGHYISLTVSQHLFIKNTVKRARASGILGHFGRKMYFLPSGDETQWLRLEVKIQRGTEEEWSSGNEDITTVTKNEGIFRKKCWQCISLRGSQI